MKKTNSKALLLGLVLGLMLPISVIAQQGGGLFGLGKSSSDYDYNGNRDGEGGVTIGGMQNDNPTPLGGGLLIMLGAGVGYVALKKKKKD